tara:strand:+ start:947 stop:1189 length:243 start_codon:yes stop_codon:yes gene_type:complete
MKKKITILIILVILGRFFLGVFSHDEFGGTHIFIKHKPTLKWNFYSPIGMSDLKLEDLSKEKQKEQILFNEFVSNRGLSK